MVNRDGQTPRAGIPPPEPAHGRTRVPASETGLQQPYPPEFVAPDGSRWLLILGPDGNFYYERCS
jgi:hypothetical protein